MSSGEVLEFAGVTKRFGTLTAVSDFSARIEPGIVTGFLGPNGAGKTTSLRVLLGLTYPSAGRATIGGKQYAELRQPLRHVGSVLEASELRPRRSAARHLEAVAKANQIPVSRVADVLNFVGLGDEADARVSSYSLGMKQRLSVATALLGDPGAFVLDEPANGLDPEGIRWIRLLIRRLADEGRSVLVSSHVLSEMQQIADDVLIISRGQLKYAGSLESLADPSGAPVVVDSLDRQALRGALLAAGLDSEILRTGLTVRGSNASEIGTIAANAGIALTTLQQRGPSLEDIFIDIVRGDWVPPTSTEADATEQPTATVIDDVAFDEAPSEAPVDEAPLVDEPVNNAVADEPAATDDLADELGDAEPAEPVIEDVIADESEASATDEPAAADGDDDTDDELPLSAYAPVAASGLGSLVQVEEPADDAVADVTHDLQDQLDALNAASAEPVIDDVSVASAPIDVIVDEIVGEFGDAGDVEPTPDEAEPIDEVVDEIVAEFGSEGDVEAAPDEAQPIDQVVDEIVAEFGDESDAAPTEPAASPRRQRRLFGRRAADEATDDMPDESPADATPTVESDVVAADVDASIGEVAESSDLEPQAETEPAAVEANPTAPDTVGAAIPEEPVVESGDGSLAASVLDDIAANLYSVEHGETPAVIDPVEAVADEAEPEVGPEVEATPEDVAEPETPDLPFDSVADDIAPRLGKLFEEPAAESTTEATPIASAFGIPILWERTDTVSNEIISVLPPVDDYLDAADDVVAGEIEPTAAPHVAATEVSTSRRRRRKRG